jgi:membrane protein implicated in regulation of membrane protease activity
VVGGVSAVLLLASVMVGLLNMAILFGLFAAAGLPMVIVYVDRVHRERQRDLEALKRIAQEAVGDEHKAADR